MRLNSKKKKEKTKKREAIKFEIESNFYIYTL